MRRTRRKSPWFATALASALLMASAVAGEPPRASDRPREKPAVNVFVNAPADLGALWKTLTRPDFVILNGDDYARLVARGNAASQARTAAPVVESVEIRGSVAGDLADLTVEASVSLNGDSPTWVPLRLDGQTLLSAQSEGHDVPVRVPAEGGGWQAELSGKGKRRVRVRLAVPVRQTAEGRRLSLAIPEAATTRLAVDVPQRLVEASSGPGEPIVPKILGESGGVRLGADLTPRSRLTLLWRANDPTGTELAPLLTARGQLAVDVEAGGVRTRSSWSIKSLRGSARTLELTLDPADEVLEVEIDGQSARGDLDRDEKANRLTLALAEPLLPGQERRLVLTTRRATGPGSPAQVRLHGLPIANAREQSGTIGVTRGADLWVSGSAGRGVRQIDPRTELPADLRARPGTGLAYQFSEQPFELTLRAEPSPPMFRAEARTTVTLGPKAARVDTWVDLRPVRGRPLEVNLEVAPGLKVESVEPEGLVESSRTTAGAGGGPSVLTVRLGSRGPDAGKVTIHVVGRQAIDPTGPVSVGLLRPIGSSSTGGRVMLLTDPSLTAELDPSGPNSEAFRPAAKAPPADWPWPADDHPSTSPPPSLWLRHDESPASLPLRVRSHPRELADSTTLLVQVGRDDVDVTQETETTVRFGRLDHLDVTVPKALEGLWAVEGGGVVQRADLGKTQAGDRLVRLRLPGESSRTSRLKFRFRLPVGKAGAPEPTARVAVPWLRVEGATEGEAHVRATVVGDPGTVVEAGGVGWSMTRDEGSNGDPQPPLRLVVSGKAQLACPLDLKVTARTLAALPKLLVPRLGLKTVVRPEGDLRTLASYWAEVHESSLAVALPRGATLLRARVDGEGVGQVEQLPDPGAFRVVFPPRGGRAPVLVEVEYTVSAARDSAWTPPRLLDGGVVQETFWEVQVPWSGAVLGIPSGWTDENEWYWDLYLWKRRPRKPRPGWPTGSGGSRRGRGTSPCHAGPNREGTSTATSSAGRALPSSWP